MSVASILDKKSGPDLVTAKPDDTIGDVARMLSERKIGAVVVTDPEGRIEGILSERDIVRAVARNGADALSLTVNKIMTHAVVACTASDSVQSLMERMTAGRFRHMPVVQQGKLIGVISIGDVVKERIEAAEREAADMRAYITTG